MLVYKPHYLSEFRLLTVAVFLGIILVSVSASAILLKPRISLHESLVSSLMLECLKVSRLSVLSLSR